MNDAEYAGWLATRGRELIADTPVLRCGCRQVRRIRSTHSPGFEAYVMRKYGWTLDEYDRHCNEQHEATHCEALGLELGDA